MGEAGGGALPPNHDVIGFLDDSVLVSTARPFGRRRAGNGGHAEAAAREYLVWRWADRALDSIGTIVGPPEPPAPTLTLSNPNGADYSMWQGDGCLPRLLHVAGTRGLWVGDPRNGVVTLLGPDGVTKATYRDTAPPLVSQEVVDGLTRRIEETERGYQTVYTAASKRAAIAAIGEVGSPRASYWSEIIPDDDGGGVWLELAKCTWESGDDTWIRLDSAARRLGTVRVPAGVKLLAVRGSLVLAVSTDDFGVESLKLLRIVE